jgi:hypothetical protein
MLGKHANFQIKVGGKLIFKLFFHKIKGIKRAFIVY